MKRTFFISLVVIVVALTAAWSSEAHSPSVSMNFIKLETILYGSITPLSAQDAEGVEVPCITDTVANGTTTNTQIPVFGGTSNSQQRSQCIYPAEMLTDLVGKRIDSLHYFVNNGSSSGWSNGEWIISMGITRWQELQFSFDNVTTLTEVYRGPLVANSTEGMTIRLDSSFAYAGGNLLIQFVKTGTTSSSSCTFVGKSCGWPASRYVSTSSGNIMTLSGSSSYFLPMVSFHACSDSTIDTSFTRQKVALPYCENFDNYRSGEGNMPLYWIGYNTLGMDMGRYPLITSEYKVSTNNSFGLHLMGNNLCYAILPDFAIDTLPDLNLSFKFRNNPTQQGMLIIGVLSDTTDMSTFMPLDTLYPPANNWEQVHYSFRNYTGTNRRVAFLDTILPGFSFADIYIDDFIATTDIQPFIHTNPMGVTLAEVPVGTTPNYWLEYGPSGFTPGYDSSQLIHVTTSPFVVPGLSRGSDYDFYSYPSIDSTIVQRGSCNNPLSIHIDPPCYSSSDTAATACSSYLWHGIICSASGTYYDTLTNVAGCDSVVTLHLTVNHCTDGIDPILCEDFEGQTVGTVPNGWTRYFSGYSTNAIIDSTYTRSGSRSIHLSLSFSTTSSVYLEMPDLELDSIQQAECYFYYYRDHDMGRLAVGVMEHTGSTYTFVPLDTITNTDAYRYELHHVSFASYTGNGRNIAFRYFETRSYSIHGRIDDIVVQRRKQPQISLVEAQTVKITADTNCPTDYWLAYDTTEFEPNGDTSALLHITQNPYYITLPLEETAYNFQIYPSYDTLLHSFTTTCHSPVTIVSKKRLPLPYCENFDNYLYDGSSGKLPAHWTRYTSTATLSTMTPSLNNLYTGVGGKSMRFMPGTNTRVCAILPDFQFDSVQQITASFDILYNTPFHNWAALYVGVMSDANDINSFVTIDTIHEINSWQHYTIDFSHYTDTGRFIAFCAYMHDSSLYTNVNIYLDNLVLTSSTTPTIVVSGSHSVNLPYTDVSLPFFVEYGTAGFFHGSGYVQKIDSLPYTIDSLDEGVTYDFYYSTDSLIYSCSPLTTITIPVITRINLDTTVCDSDLPLTWLGHTYTAAASLSDTIRTGISIDSVINYTLTVNLSNSGDTTAIACDSFTWYGNIYTASATPSHTFTNAAGCDSMVTLHLTINHSNTGDTTAVACDSFSWYGQTYTESTETQTHTLTNTAGCDSVVTLHMTVNYSSHNDITEYACDSYVWDVDGQTYTSDTTLHAQFVSTQGCDSIVTMHLRIRPSPVLQHIPDTVLDYGQSITLHASGASIYSWHNAANVLLGNDSVITVTPTVSTVYYLTAFNEGSNIVYNGDFELGNTGFTTVYHYSNSLGPEGYYYVGPSARSCHPGFTGEYDHTSGNGNYMIVNGAAGIGTNLWSQTVSVQPNTDYAFSVWGTNLSPYAQNYMAQLQFSINGVQLGEVFQLPTTMNAWSQFYEVWNSGTNTTATITILNMNTNLAGNDFGVDDIHFSSLSTCQSRDTVRVFIGQHIDTIVCDNQFPFIWNGQTFLQPGAKMATLTASNGSDSIIIMNVAMSNSIIAVEELATCDSYTWIDGNTYTASTSTPSFTLANAAGCDSTVTLHLTVNYSSTGTETVTACNSYVWHGTEYTESTDTASHLSTNSVGCDSVTTLHLTIDHCSTTTLTACDQYTWNGVTYTSSGTHTSGTDTLVLTIHYSNTGDTSAVICDSFAWHGTTYTQSTDTPTHTYINHAGCDSVVTLHLSVNYSNTGDTTAVACDSFSWHGETYSESTETPTHIYTNTAGCDSTVTLHLTMNYSSTGTETVTACNSYVWHGTEYTESTDTASHLSTNSVGCDSVTTLHLTINHCSTTTLTACDQYTWNGATYTSSGNYTSGTDTLVLTVLYSNTGDTTAVACDSFSWWNTNYSNSTNSATHIYTNAIGCDSVVTLHLTITSSNTGDTVAVACDSFAWYGITYTQSTETPTHTYTNHAGCDSTVTLLLTINNRNSGDTSAVVCDSFVWHGITYTQSTETPTHSHTNHVGCDSTVTLHLTINNSNTGDTSAVICDSFAWHGTTYTQSTDTPTHTYINHAGCDSVVTLHLTVNYSNTGDTVAVACDSFAWHGITYTESTETPTHTYTDTANCDSTVTLHLTISSSYEYHFYDTLRFGDTVLFEGERYFYPGDHQHYYSSEEGCDSIHTLHLVKHYFIELMVRDSLCEGDTLYWGHLTVSESGEYDDTLYANDFSIPDTVAHLTAVKVSHPQVSIDSSWDCGDNPHYTLTAVTNVEGYYLWSGLADSIENVDKIEVNPLSNTDYRLYVDYRKEPLCASTATISIEPLKTVEAAFSTSPEHLNDNNRHLTAINRSNGPFLSWEWNVWFDGEYALSSFEPTLALDVPFHADSLRIGLIVNGEQCSDTAETEIDILKSTIFFPNVFTPTLETNNQFRGYGIGILEFEIWIYDRRGLEVYHSTNMDEGWDGTSPRGTCPQGAYAYKCRYREENTPGGWQVITGDVTLLR